MGDSLDASWLSRIRHGWRPDWSRTARARRIIAGVLVLAAAVSALRPDPSTDLIPVVVAAHDLTPGSELTADDISVTSRTAAAVPDGSIGDTGAVVGAMLTGPTRRGEVITDVRIVGTRLAQAAAGPDARIVPLHLTDAALLDLLRPGDVVDVLAGADSALDPSGQRPDLLATDARVVLVSARPKSVADRGDRILLVALPKHTAHAVAGASLLRSITVTLH